MFKEIFGTVMMILIMFNILYFVAFTTEENILTMESVVNLGLNLILTGGVLGITAATVGLDSESIRILVGGVALSLILFSLPIGINFANEFHGFNLGIGLVSHVANKFGSDLLGYPSLIINSMGLVALISGLMVISGND